MGLLTIFKKFDFTDTECDTNNESPIYVFRTWSEHLPAFSNRTVGLSLKSTLVKFSDHDSHCADGRLYCSWFKHDFYIKDDIYSHTNAVDLGINDDTDSSISYKRHDEEMGYYNDVSRIDFEFCIKILQHNHGANVRKPVSITIEFNYIT